MFLPSIKAAFSEFAIGRDVTTENCSLAGICKACRLMDVASGRSVEEASEILAERLEQHVCPNATPTR